MKQAIQSFTAMVALLLASASGADDISSWRAVLLAKPFHVGDSKLREMDHRNPEGERFTGKFQLPPAIPASVATIVYANIEVAGVLPMSVHELTQVREQHSLGTCLEINGKHAAIINEFSKVRANSRYQKVSIRIPGSLLRRGENVLQIIPGRRSQIDDIELRSVTVSSRPE